MPGFKRGGNTHNGTREKFMQREPYIYESIHDAKQINSHRKDVINQTRSTPHFPSIADSLDLPCWR